MADSKVNMEGEKNNNNELERTGRESKTNNSLSFRKEKKLEGGREDNKKPS